MSAVEERIRMLRDRFAESLPNRLADIRRTWMRLNANPSQDLLEQFTRQIHTLGGTAGTYGLSSVAALAVEGELACEDLNESIDPDTLRYLGMLIEDIGGVVETWLDEMHTPALVATDAIPHREVSAL